MSEATHFLGEHYSSLPAARDFLEYFLRDDDHIGSRNNEGYDTELHFDRALHILHMTKFATIKTLLIQFPILAAEKFAGFFPLTYFIWNGYDSNTLDSIFSLYPEVLCKPQLEHRNLLELACSYLYTSDEVVFWLLSKCDGNFPESSTDGFPRFIPAFAKMLNVKYERVNSSRRNYNALLFRAHQGISDQVIQAFAAKEPNLAGYSIFAIDAIQTMKDDIEKIKWRTLVGGVPSAIELCVDLPASMLESDPQNFQVLLQFLQRPSIHVATFTIRGCQVEVVNNERLINVDRILEVWPNLREAVTSPQALKKATMRLLRLLTDITPAIPCLKLEQFDYLDMTAVANLANKYGTLVLNKCRLSSPQSLPSIYKNGDAGNMAVWHGISKLPNFIYIELTSNLNSCRDLQRLKILCQDNDEDCKMSNALVAIIKAQSQLETIEVTGPACYQCPFRRPEIKMDEICEALYHNTSLKTLQLDQLNFGELSFRETAKMVLQVVQEKNTSLQRITANAKQFFLDDFGSKQLDFANRVFNTFHSDSHHSDPPHHSDDPEDSDASKESVVLAESGHRIRYALLLNEYGRRMVRDKSATLETFIAVMAKVNAASIPASIRYGLMRESPLLWSQSALVTTRPVTAYTNTTSSAILRVDTTSNSKKRGRQE